MNNMNKIKIIVDSNVMELEIVVKENKAERELKKILKQYKMLASKKMHKIIAKRFDYKKRKYIPTHTVLKDYYPEDAYIKIKTQKL